MIILVMIYKTNDKLKYNNNKYGNLQWFILD